MLITKTEKILVACFAAVYLIIAGFLSFNTTKLLVSVSTPQQNHNLGSAEGSPSYINAISSTATLVTTSSTLVAGTSTARIYLRLTNIGAFPIFCSMNMTGTSTAVAATIFSGITILASSTFVMNPNDYNLYHGPVYCISASGNSTTTVYQR